MSEKNKEDEIIGTFLLIKTTRLFPEPNRAIVEQMAAIPIKKAISPNFVGSKIPAIRNQNAIPIAYPPISPMLIEINPLTIREFFMGIS